MSFSIVGIIRRLIAPKHELSCARFLWRRLVANLRERGQGNHESGAFLLGRSRDEGGRIVDFVLYDDLDPHSLDTGIVRFDGRYFGTLWELCTNRRLTVVADVHTHHTLEESIRRLGATSDRPPDRETPKVIVGGAPRQRTENFQVRLVFEGWRGGIVPAHVDLGFREANAMPLSAVFSAAFSRK